MKNLVRCTFFSLVLLLHIQAFGQVSPGSQGTQPQKTELEKGLIDSTEEKRLKRFYVAVHKAEVMDEADSFSDVIARIPIEEVVEALSDTPGRERAASRHYVKVRLKDGREGWILESMLADEISASSASAASVRPGSGSQSAGAGASGTVGYTDYSDLKLSEPEDVRATSTGRTTGHIADLGIKNITNAPQSIELPPCQIPSDGMYQGYVIVDSIQADIPVEGEIIIPIIGYCTDVLLLPVPAGVPMPPVHTWIPETPLTDIVNEVTNTITTLQSTGQITTPFSTDRELEKTILVQHIVWLTNDAPHGHYTIDDLCTHMRTQFETFSGKPYSDLTPDEKLAIDHSTNQLITAVKTAGKEADIPVFATPSLPPSAADLVKMPPSGFPKIEQTIKATGTGRTTGHIADISVSNPGDHPVTVQFGPGPFTGEDGIPYTRPLFIPSGGQYQPYVVPMLPTISLKPGESKTITVTGFCVDIHKPPVPSGGGMPPFSSWIGQTISDPLHPPSSMGDPSGSGSGRTNSSSDQQVVSIPTLLAPPLETAIDLLFTNQPMSKPGPTENTSVPGQTSSTAVSKDDCPDGTVTTSSTIPGTTILVPAPVKTDLHPAIAVPLLFDAIDRITEAYEKLSPTGDISTPFSGNPEKERESVIQQTFWMYTSGLSGEKYDKKNFTDNTIRQFEKNTGTTFDQVTEPQKEKVQAGVDDFWDTFEAVGVEAKVLDLPPAPPVIPSKLVDQFWKDDSTKDLAAKPAAIDVAVPTTSNTPALEMEEAPPFIPEFPGWNEENMFQAAGDRFKGVIEKIEGDTADIIITLPDGSILKNPKPGDTLPMNTTIVTGENSSLILRLEGEQGGKEFKNAKMTVRQNTEVKLDTLAVQASNVVTRVQIKTGEVRIKVTDDRQDFSTDTKVATPNSTSAVNGTEFTITVFNGYDTVDVTEGCVQVKPHQGQTEKKVCAGSKVKVNRTGKIE